MSRSNQDSNQHAVWYTALAFLVLLIGLSWYLWPTRLEMSRDTYDVAIALYRVCNQQDSEGLRKIQNKLDELRSVTDSDDPAVAHLQSIVDQAREGGWSAAMRQTRSALEDQVSGA